MELIPAIDLLDGKVVRLHKGDYATATSYGDDPIAIAESYANAGAKRLHVVDLDGARSGEPRHLRVITEILKQVELDVQVGGGIRSRERAQQWLDAGAARVVLGTVAVRDPSLASELCAANPGRIIIAIDARGEDVAVEGWREGSGQLVAELAGRADEWEAVAVLYTDIDRDGTGRGPAVARTARLQEELRATVIASGGIGSLEHLRALREADVRAAVCGRALLEGAFTLTEALSVLEEGR